MEIKIILPITLLFTGTNSMLRKIVMLPMETDSSCPFMALPSTSKWELKVLVLPQKDKQVKSSIATLLVSEATKWKTIHPNSSIPLKGGMIHIILRKNIVFALTPKTNCLVVLIGHGIHIFYARSHVMPV